MSLYFEWKVSLLPDIKFRLWVVHYSETWSQCMAGLVRVHGFYTTN